VQSAWEWQAACLSITREFIMSKGLRLTEKWMQRTLWLVAFVFAGFLIGLGSLIVQNVRDVEEPLTLEQFMDPAQLASVQAEREAAHKAQEQAQSRL
jgi:preprotein translocase subunit SecG